MQLPVVKKNLLKSDLFGQIWEVDYDGGTAILRDTSTARWWLAWPARLLLRREARALAVLQEDGQVPTLLSSARQNLIRSYVPGEPMHVARPDSADFYREASRLLRRLHAAGVAHNDLAKEVNILVNSAGNPAFVDFQLASLSPRRGRLFRIAAREDLRHLLKHKRTYRPDLLTRREQAILKSPSILSRAWMSLGKPVYLFVTRRLLGWADREGAADR